MGRPIKLFTKALTKFDQPDERCRKAQNSTNLKILIAPQLRRLIPYSALPSRQLPLNTPACQRPVNAGSHKNNFHQRVRFDFFIGSIELNDKFPAVDAAEPISGARLFKHRRKKKFVGELSSPITIRHDSRARRRLIFNP